MFPNSFFCLKMWNKIYLLPKEQECNISVNTFKISKFCKTVIFYTSFVIALSPHFCTMGHLILFKQKPGHNINLKIRKGRSMFQNFSFWLNKFAFFKND